MPLEPYLHLQANPRRFRRWAEPLAPWLVGLGLLGLISAWGLGLVIEAATVDQKESARIFFVHVPLALSCTLIYAAMALASLLGLIFRHELAHLVTQALAPLGAVITLAAFVSGAVWGLDDWGQGLLFEPPRSMLTDPRLLSVELLLLQYMAYLGLLTLFETPQQARQAGAVFVLASVVTVLFVRYSPVWFNSIHQGATLHNREAVKPIAYLWVTYAGLLSLWIFTAGLTLWRVFAQLDRHRADLLAQRRIRGRASLGSARVERQS